MNNYANEGDNLKKLGKLLPELNRNQLRMIQRLIDEAYIQGINDGE